MSSEPLPPVPDPENGLKPQQNPIFEAVKIGKLSPVQELVEKHGVGILSLRDEKSHTAAHWACLGGHTSLLRYMIENKASIDEANSLGAHPIHWACVNGHVAVVDILTQCGVDLDTVDGKRCTPLIVAAQYGHTMLVGYLMGKGARLQLTDKDGDNALHWAAFKGHNEMMRLLIYSGFDPKQKDNFGQSVLHMACINGNLTAVRELCEQDGVDIDVVDSNGKTPMMLALGRKHDQIVLYLKDELKHQQSMIPRINLWVLIFGPPGNSKMAFLFYIVCVALWGYPMYLIKCLPVLWDDLWYLHSLFMLTNWVMWVCLYHANTTNPGYLPRNIPEYDLAIKQVAHFDEWKQGNNPLSRLCHTCRTIKPLRAKHCRMCNRCVLEFDHHCPYIHNCVGYNNRVSFLGVCSTMTLIGLLTMYFSYEMIMIEGIGWDTPDRWLGLALMTIFEGIAGILAITTVQQAAVNVTTNEWINRKRYDYLKDDKGAFYNPFDKGIVPNLLEYMHLRPTPKYEDVRLMGVKSV